MEPIRRHQVAETPAEVLEGGVGLPMPAAGRYFFAGASTNSSLGTGTLRCYPFIVTKTIIVDRVGAEITQIGDVGSKLRVGVYADNGFGAPDALLLDAGQIAGDSATVQDLTIDGGLELEPGVYWVGGVVQAVSSTQPTVRTVTSSATPAPPISTGMSTPPAGASPFGYTASGVTGALPANFTVASTSGSCPRIHLRRAP